MDITIIFEQLFSKQEIYCYASLAGKETEAQRLSDFFTKVTQLARGRAGTGAQASLMSKQISFLEILIVNSPCSPFSW